MHPRVAFSITAAAAAFLLLAAGLAGCNPSDSGTPASTAPVPPGGPDPPPSQAKPASTAPPASSLPPSSAPEDARQGAHDAAAAAPMGRMIHWDGRSRSYQVGPLTITMSAGPRGDGESPAPAPILEVHGGGAQGRDVGERGFDAAAADFGVFRLDRSSPLPQVLFGSFTGGAHCCYRIDVIEQVGGAWKVLPLGAFDGDPPAHIHDIDGDGTPDIVMIDDAFDYAFGCFACSWRPPMVFNVRDGQVWDVSAQPRYRPLFLADMQKAERICRSGQGERNGACAGFVADASRIGRHDWAWKVMLASYEPQSQWGLPDGCVAVGADGRCPKGQEIHYRSFPEALEAFLRRNGYLDAAGDRPVQPRLRL
jgi:hypothetical protein